MPDKRKILIQTIAQTIYDKKGLNPICLDIKGKSTLTDYIILAEGNVDRHVVAIGKAIIESASEIDQAPLFTEGLSHGDWVVIDFCDVIVHIFSPGLREKYQLEKLWSEGTLVDLNIECKSEGIYE